jgi:hypothetical protein
MEFERLMNLRAHSVSREAPRGRSATAITKLPGSPPRSSVGCLLRQIFRHPLAQCCSNTSPRKRAGCTEGPNANGKSSALASRRTKNETACSHHRPWFRCWHVPHDRRRRDDLRRDQNNRCSMTTVAGIFISAPHDGQIYVAERSRCHSGLGTFATSTDVRAIRHRPAIAEQSRL